jgi:DNA invertase Pin-like site-specific DNA recombinase
MRYAFGKTENEFESFVQFGVLADSIYIGDYIKLKLKLKAHDTLVVSSIYSLGNNKGKILNELKDLVKMKIHLKVFDIPTTLLDFKNDELIAALLLGIVVETFESCIDNDIKNTKQRQREGIKKAQREGKYIGRTPIHVDWDKFKELYPIWKNGEMTAVEFRKRMGLSTNTFYRRLKEYEAELHINKTTMSEDIAAFLDIINNS